jgi:hypothetical protein
VWGPPVVRPATSLRAHGTGTTSVLVVTEVDQTHVVAYYAWCMASVAIADLPERLRRGAGCYPQPIALLACLGDATGDC